MTDETELHIGRIEEEILDLEDRIANLRAYLGHLKAGGTPGDWEPLPPGGVPAFFGTWPGDETDEEWDHIIEGLKP